MNADLEETLNEMGPDYREVVDRLLAPVEQASSPARQRNFKNPHSEEARRLLNGNPARRLLNGNPARRLLNGNPARRLLNGWRAAALLAASLVIGLGVAWYFALPEGEQAGTPALRESPYVLAYSSDASSVAALVRTQRADGSWANDFLTRQNAAALRTAQDEAAHVAYRRALRYLRAKGLAPLTAAELRAREAFASRRLGV